MEQFSADIQGLNSKHSIIGEELAGDLSSRFPRLQHAFSAANRDDISTAGVEPSAEAGVVALLPLDSSSGTRQALENALHQITTTGSDTIVVDMDIADPHNTLPGHSGGEGISDHFLYGVSPDQLIGEGPADSSIKVISPGTFTPRASEIYSDDGWNDLIDRLSASAPGATVLLIGPPVDKFSSLSALSKASTAIVLSGRLDDESQQALPSIIEKLQAKLPSDAQFKLLWIDTEPPADNEQEAAADEPALKEEEPVLVEDVEKTVETEEVPQTDETPTETEEETTIVPEQSQVTDSTPDTEEEISTEIDVAPEETEQSPETPDEPQNTITQLTADGVSLESEKLPGQRSLESSVDDGVKDDTFGDIELPGLSEASVETNTDTPKAEDDEEIFLPDELLFLDEEEQAAAETVSESNNSADIDEQPAVIQDEPAEETELEAVAEPEAETDDSAPEIPDLSAIDVEDIQPVQDQPEESVEPADESLPVEQELPIEADDEPAEEGEKAAVEDDEELDADALFSDDDLDDEEEEAEEATSTADSDDLDDEALAMIEKFRETSDKPQDSEHDLALDDDPLGEGGEEQEPQDTKAPELTEEPAAESDDTPAAEAIAEEEQEAMEELEPVAEVEQETEPAADEEQVAETELETEDESLAELDAEPEAEVEAETPSDEAEEEEAEDAMLVEEDLIDITEGDAPLEAEEDTEEEAVEAEAVEEAEAEPETVEEVAELDADELEEIETGDLESLDEEINTTADDQSGEELEEVAEDSDETVEPADTQADDGDGLDVPADDELDELLSGTDDMEDLDGGITLDELDEIDDVQPAAAGKGRKKAGASKSRSKPAVMLVLLIVMGFGLFFIWKQGYVSKLVRQVPALSSVAGFIPTTSEERKQEQEAIQQAAADSAAKADSLSKIPPPPQYDKLGYSIQIGSYRYLPQAMAIRDRLVQNGLQDVFVVPLVLDSLGNWNRLYMGMYRSAGRGDTALLNLATDLRRSGISDGVSGGAITRHTPLTLMVAEASDPDSLQSVMDKLETNHIPSYMIQLAQQDSLNPPLYRLYSGAFENESQAAFLRSQIFNIGVRATVIEREGPAEQQDDEEQQDIPTAPPV